MLHNPNRPSAPACAVRDKSAHIVIMWLAMVATETAQALPLEMVAASDTSFAEPHDIVLSPDGTRLYVADNGNDRIVVLHPQSLEELGVFAEREVSAPHDVAFDPSGRLLVADTGNSRIAIYALDGHGGELVDTLQGRVRRPEGVATHADGRVFATGAASGNLAVYRDGQVIEEVGGFSSPHDVVIGPDEGIWVADADNNRVVRLDESLQETKVLVGPPYDFNGPRYLDFDARGRLYVADKYNNQIKILDADGNLVHILGDTRPGLAPGAFDRPEGVAIRGHQVWFSDTYNDRIVLYRITDLE